MNRCSFEVDHTDSYGRRWCTCKRLETHEVHQPRPRPVSLEDVAELEARILGEYDREDED